MLTTVFTRCLAHRKPQETGAPSSSSSFSPSFRRRQWNVLARAKPRWEKAGLMGSQIRVLTILFCLTL